MTLTGSGGCGKTRLALHAAAELVDAPPGRDVVGRPRPGDHRATRSPSASPAAVGATAAPGADPTARRGAPPARRGRDAGRDRQRRARRRRGGRRWSTAVLSACPDVRVLVTSREPLGVAGEMVWRVPSLRVPPRRRGGRARAARRLRSGAAVRRPGPAGAAELRRRRRRPPPMSSRSAPASTASRWRSSWPPPGSAPSRSTGWRRGLDDAFRLLTGGARTALPRQQTLLASIAWSDDLLDDAERAVLRRLAVFRGPFTLEAAEAVGRRRATRRRPTTCSTCISRLVDKSLVLLDDDDRPLPAAGDDPPVLPRPPARRRRAGDHGDRHATLVRRLVRIARPGRARLRHRPDPPDAARRVRRPGLGLRQRRPRTPTASAAASPACGRMIGHYADFDRQYAWLAGRDGSDDPAGWAAAVAGLSYSWGPRTGGVRRAGRRAEPLARSRRHRLPAATCAGSAIAVAASGWRPHRGGRAHGRRPSGRRRPRRAYCRPRPGHAARQHRPPRRRRRRRRHRPTDAGAPGPAVRPPHRAGVVGLAACRRGVSR